jgi:hypothetical protein
MALANVLRKTGQGVFQFLSDSYRTTDDKYPFPRPVHCATGVHQSGISGYVFHGKATETECRRLDQIAVPSSQGE